MTPRPDAGRAAGPGVVRLADEIAPPTSVSLVVDGDLRVRGAQGTVELGRGATAIAPYAAGRLTLEGAGEVLVCRPPAP